MMNPFINKAKLPTHLKYKLLSSGGEEPNLLTLTNRFYNYPIRWDGTQPKIDGGKTYAKVNYDGINLKVGVWFLIFIKVKNYIDLGVYLTGWDTVYNADGEEKIGVINRLNNSIYANLRLNSREYNLNTIVYAPFILYTDEYPELVDKLSNLGYSTQQERATALANNYADAFIYDYEHPEYFYIDLDKIV